MEADTNRLVMIIGVKEVQLDLHREEIERLMKRLKEVEDTLVKERKKEDK